MTTKYVTGVVIANGVPDNEGDILNKSDIKRIFTKYINRETDIMHTKIRNEGVDVLANWISEVDTEIDGKIAPSGSWLATMAITNDEINKSIESDNPKSINGLSLGSISATGLTQKLWFINKSVNYRDIDNIEDVKPLFISFVDRPSNGFGLESEDYNIYINKNAKEDENMVETEEKSEQISLSTLEKITKLFGVNKSSNAESVETEGIDINKNANPPVNESVPFDASELSKKIDDLPQKISASVVEGFKQALGEINPNNPTESKNKKESEEGGEKPPKTEKEPSEPKKEEDDTKDIEINKRSTSNPEHIEMPENNTNFYKLSNRTMYGLPKRK